MVFLDSVLSILCTLHFSMHLHFSNIFCWHASPLLYSISRLFKAEIAAFDMTDAVIPNAVALWHFLLGVDAYI